MVKDFVWNTGRYGYGGRLGGSGGISLKRLNSEMYKSESEQEKAAKVFHSILKHNRDQAFDYIMDCVCISYKQKVRICEKWFPELI